MSSPLPFLEQYEPLDVIGNGSFGIIRKYTDRNLAQIFARKELNFERMSERDRKQIVAEVNILKDLHQEHIVAYHDRYVDRDAGILYILMEYCGGGDLSGIIKQASKQNRPISEDTIWNYFMQILLALHHCHHPNGHGRSSSGSGSSLTSDGEGSGGNGRRPQILHRDLKPDNVFLDENNNVKLGDFGLSKALAQASFANTYVGVVRAPPPESEGTLVENVDAQPQVTPDQSSNPLTLSINTNIDPYNPSQEAWLQDLAWVDPNILESIISSNALDVIGTDAPTVPQVNSEIVAKLSNVHMPDLCHSVPAPVLTPTVDAPISATSRPEPPPQAPPLPPAPWISHTHPTLFSTFQQTPALPDPSSIAPLFGSSHHVAVSGASGMATSPLSQLPSTPAMSMPATFAPNATHTPVVVPSTNMASVVFQAPGSNAPAAPHASHPLQPISFSFLQPPSFTSSGNSHANRHEKQQPTDENAPPRNSVSCGAAGDGQRGKENDEGTTAHAPPQDMENGTRRSRRAPVPSTRLDKLNEIGTNIIPPKPPVNTLSNNEEPPWFAPAYNYLKQSTLGVGWTSLVERWAHYERIKGWKSGKGLPAKGRPEEWQQWASKARYGIRNYNNLPVIEDAADLGIAVLAWAGSFSNADFCRTGPHGMVVLLTLTAWWGTAASHPSSYNVDSRPQWDTLVQDLFTRFDQRDSASKRVREDDNLGQSLENKRPRVDA
ncbi:hypothetical protein EST38_g13148 [Candolleomyces aberdarensis]|uniref:non-specific serine/threonine protein kinase n=1 Tax=Candolleomyces aberdarensis TaxID=2316362 RepID=A0A4V1Q1T5_9AGAR|nr:hypothetical protein EST38_g13148 [Candolleomyces aberdarensis]